jgi:glutaredoxin
MIVTIYSKPGCHLCDEMKTIVRRVQHGRPDISFEEIDISKDAVLLDRYGVEIPVLMIDGRKVGKYRITETALKEMLNRIEKLEN